MAAVRLGVLGAHDAQLALESTYRACRDRRARLRHPAVAGLRGSLSVNGLDPEFGHRYLPHVR